MTAASRRLKRARRLLRRAAVGLVRLQGGVLGLDLVAGTPYSPVPRVPPAGADVWSRPASLVGVDLDPLAHLEFLETQLGPYLSEFEPPAEPGGPGEFYLWNDYYQAVDAEVLYAVVRHLKPRTMLEIGSGFSTLVSLAALRRNAEEGRPGELVAVDPDPRIPLPRGAGVPACAEATPAQELPLERFLELGGGDILFVDGSHTVKLGSEVNFVVLEVLPRLRPGVVVHFHDIFLPYEYPRSWYQRGTVLAEQYLLHAFLIGNRDYEILFGSQAVVRAYPERVARLIPSVLSPAENYPAAFWIVRRDAASGR